MKRAIKISVVTLLLAAGTTAKATVPKMGHFGTGTRIAMYDGDKDASPVFNQRSGKVSMNLLNTDRSTVSIIIRDARNRVVYSETVGNKVHVGKVFNFTDAFEGRYTITVTDGGETYTEKVVVN